MSVAIKTAASVCLLLLSLAPLASEAQEFRAFWVDTFHAGLRNSAEVSQLVADARAANCNALIVEVRKRGDAYYHSHYEPKAADVSPQSFDPLADLVAKAHSGTPRLEVHAWISSYLIWQNQTTAPSQPDHPFLLHPDWLSQNSSGVTWDGSNYQFDQGHPEVQQHVFNVAMDIVSGYDVDGFHFDYIRYSGKDWGYHPLAVSRFNARFHGSGLPSSNDPDWLQFRRDQVTALVRKTYLSAIAIKPRVKVSAATICFAPGITTDVEWYNSAAAWTDKLQDWRGWLEEGILDLAVPMAYFRQPVNGTDWAKWSTFAKDHRYGRHAAMGLGIYLNSASNAIYQLRSTRTLTRNLNSADGVALYSYAVTGTNVNRSQFIDALTSAPSAHDPAAEAVFATPVAIPDMPWKSAPTLGHLKGLITSSSTGLNVDGAALSLVGPVRRTTLSDATGFYGFVDLPPGSYTVTASFSNLLSLSSSTTITVGSVRSLSLALDPLPPPVLASVVAWPGQQAALVSWNTTLPADSQVAYGLTTNLDSLSPLDPLLTTNHTVFIGGLAGETDYFFRVLSQAGTNLFTSDLRLFRTAGEVVVDNPAATLTGSWSVGTASTDKYGSNYRFATAVSGSTTATATFTPVLATPGTYDVYVWYPQGGNRSTSTPHLISWDGGSATVRVDQSSGGGGWRLLASGKPFARGSAGFVRVSNDSGDTTTKVVMADAIRFVFDGNQDTPPDGVVPTWWAQAYFGSQVVDASLDPDHDGLSTAQEYVLGTNPTRAGSGLQFRAARSGPTQVSLAFWPWQAGRNCQLQARSDLISAPWRNVSDVWTVGADGWAACTVTNLIAGQEFYRLQISLSGERLAGDGSFDPR